MKVNIEYTNGDIDCYDDVLDIILADFHVEIYLKREDVKVVGKSEIENIEIEDF